MSLRVFQIEAERYELSELPHYRFDLDRRGFLQTLGAGILIISLIDRAEAQDKNTGSWLHINSDTGKVTVFTGKTEVGQNIRTSLSQAVAEELGTPVSNVELIMADTDRVPYDRGTFGSQTTPQMAPQLRRAAAAALKLSGLHAPLGESLPKVNGRNFVTGAHKYTSDLYEPGMLFGKVIRPAQYGASVAAFDATAAEKLPGVKIVRDGNFAGVIAPSSSAAAEAAKTCAVSWKPSTDRLWSNATLFDDWKAAKPEPHAEIDAALATAKHKLDRTYTVAYVAHVPLEPRAAVAQWSADGKLTVRTGTQVPFGVREELATAFGIKTENVRVIVPDTGSGYGGKHTGECAVEAARLAKAAGGKPVKLVWTREEEFTWAYFRPAGVISVRSAIDDNGRLTAWDFHNYNAGGSAIQTLYEVAAKRTEFHQVTAPLRQGSYRGLAATANHFAREVHMDELATLAGKDPLEFRSSNTKDERLKAVLQAAADRFGWTKARPKGAGFGIACGFEKGGYVACCAEVAVEAGGKPPKVIRLVEAFECGAIVNPNHLRMQVEGGMVMGLGGALFESIQFSNGRLLNGRLSKYRVPRFRDIPPIEVVLLDRKDLPSAGAGETPIVGVAPALSNAIHAATGERLRALPLFGTPAPVDGSGTN